MLTLHNPPEPERREYIGEQEAVERFSALLEREPQVRLAEGTKRWAERVERQREARAR